MIYRVLLELHTWVRWLVLASLAYSVFRAYKGYTSKSVFGKTDNAVRHWTATIAHLQLVIGIILYSQSPVARFFWSGLSRAADNKDTAFFGFVHAALMLTAIIVVTIGSALAKRQQLDGEKFRTMLVWFSVALLIIFMAIPWPFSPLAHRPYFR